VSYLSGRGQSPHPRPTAHDLWTAPSVEAATEAEPVLLPSLPMAAAPTYEVVCPHCKKPFRGELMGGDDHRQGFKCPHCRLFVPYERAETEESD
jgi:hypothetical protein